MTQLHEKKCPKLHVEHDSSVVECRTRNQVSPGSNPICYRFEVWAFSFSYLCLSRLSCINEYLAIDSGGNVSEVVAVIAAWLDGFQEKPSWCRNEQVCQGRKSVKRFEGSNGLDTALYKNIPLLLHVIFFLITWISLAILMGYIYHLMSVSITTQE